MSYPEAKLRDIRSEDGNLTYDTVQEPQTAPTATDSGVAGVLNGTYSYMCTFVTSDGETEGRVQSSDVTVVNKKVSLTAIPVSTDRRVTARNIFRKPAAFSADVVPLQFLVQIADNTTTTYTDNIEDASLGALINRQNSTGGAIYNGLNQVFQADTTSLSIGYDSDYAGTGYAGTAVGIHAMPTNAGVRNTAIGMYANNGLVDGGNNTAVGVHAMQTNISGSNNTAMGYTAGYSFTGSDLTAIGFFAAHDNVTGTNCTAVGRSAATKALSNNTTAIGYNALGGLVTGAENTAVGASAGAVIVAGSAATSNINCTFIGANTKPLNATDTGCIVIGRTALGKGTNTVVIGATSNVQNYLYGGLNLDKTITAAGTTGAQTINKPIGSVNFAAAATSLVVTNSLVSTSSVILCTVGTNDSTMKDATAVAAAGSFTIRPNVAPTAETRVNFLVIN